MVRNSHRAIAVARVTAVLSLALLLVLSARPSLADDILTQVHSKWAWSTYGSRVGLKGFEVADVDGDGRSEILATTSLGGKDWWYQVNFSGRLLQTWSSFPIEGETALRALGLAQATESYLAVVLTPSTVEVFDAASKKHRFGFETLSSDNKAIAVADLAGDGSLEAVVCDAQDLTVYDLASGTPMHLKQGFGCADIDVGQVDADPQLEIAIAGNAFGGYVFDGLTLTLDGGDIFGFGARVALADLNADGRDEVVFVRGWSLRAQNPSTGLLLWQSSIPASFFGYAFSIAEMSPSPGREVVLADGYSVSVLAGIDGSPLWTLPFLGSVAAVGAGDVDGDGILDLLWSSGGSVFLSPSEAPAAITQTDPFEGEISGLGVGRFSGAGEVEVLTSSSGSSAFQSGILVALSFSQGRQLRRSSAEDTEVLSDIQEMVASQLDDDAQLEVCAWADFEPGVACFDGLTFEEQWSTGILSGITTMTIAEVDNAAPPEVITGSYVGAGARVTVQEGESGSLKWQSPPTVGAAIESLAAVDPDSNGNVQIVAGFSGLGTSYSALVRFDAETGLPVGEPWERSFSAMATRPASPDPAANLFLGTASGEVAEIDLASGELEEPIATFPGAVQAIELADLTRDGVEDVVAAVEDGHLYLFDGALQEVTWVSPYLGYLGFVRTDGMLAGDFNADTVPDLLIQTPTGVFAFEGPLVVLFGDGFDSGDLSAWSWTNP